MRHQPFVAAQTHTTQLVSDTLEPTNCATRWHTHPGGPISISTKLDHHSWCCTRIHHTVQQRAVPIYYLHMDLSYCPATSPAGPVLVLVMSGLKPSCSGGMLCSTSLASYTRMRSLWALDTCVAPP